MTGKNGGQNMQFKSCGECNACCQGLLYGNAYGNVQSMGQQCKFLVSKRCSIYDTRPKFCFDYQCAYTQGLLDEDMRPDKCGLLATVKYDETTQKQYLHVTETKPDIPWETYMKLDKSVHKLGTYWVLRKWHDIQS